MDNFGATIGSTTSRLTSKAPLFTSLFAALIVFGGLGYYFNIHAPELQRVEQSRIEREREEVEARWAESARVAAAEQEAERQRILAERVREEQEQAIRDAAMLEAHEREEQAGREIDRISSRGEFEAATRNLTRSHELWRKKAFSAPEWERSVADVEVAWEKLARLETGLANKGMALISATPEATVISLGPHTASGTLLLLELEAGEHEFTAKLDGYRFMSDRVVIERGQLARPHHITMQKIATPLTIPPKGQFWENSLGMRFVLVPGTNVLFSIWETRVQDYQQFVDETRLAWPKTYFPQGATHPAVLITYEDAVSFCRWLTEKERLEGWLGPDQEYRLPTDIEWGAAVGPDEFPWGNKWPPPRGVGNYADEAAKRGLYPSWTIIGGYDDGHDATAPVGSFAANLYGLYDLGGNVWERVRDRQHGIRGGSFLSFVRWNLASTVLSASGSQSFEIGFRIVVTVGSIR